MCGRASQGDEALLQAGCFVVDTVLAFATGAQTSNITVDTDALPSGDVGEWDPFINALSQGNPNTASKTSRNCLRAEREVLSKHS